MALVLRKDALEDDTSDMITAEDNGRCDMISREEAIQKIAENSKDDIIICTTGKASRELFEIRESLKMGHDNDFLTVGSMGHASSIALGVAFSQPSRTVWCIDGDGAALMHLGAMVVIGDQKPDNLKHIIINNGAHESVGGWPTALRSSNISDIARACGYMHIHTVSNTGDLLAALMSAKDVDGLTLIEIYCNSTSRQNLSRPTTTAIQHKLAFMNKLSGSQT
jgi:phosphonopyruvate decarboxylase